MDKQNDQTSFASPSRPDDPTVPIGQGGHTPQPSVYVRPPRSAKQSNPSFLGAASSLPYVSGTARNRRRFPWGKAVLGLVAAVLLFASGMLAGAQQQYQQILTFVPPTTLQLPDGGRDSISALREAVIARVRPSVVQINTTGARGRGGLGSGVANAQTLEVVFADGTTLPGDLVGAAPADDLAVVKVDPSKVKLTVISLADSSKARVGEDVLAIGNPLGITQTVTSGIISALDRNVTESGPNATLLPHMIQTDAPINPGNSGGALVDMQGQLVGIPTLGVIDPEYRAPANGVGFAIPSNRVKFIAPQLIQYKQVKNTGRASLDIRGTTVDKDLQQHFNLSTDKGVLIVSTTENGAAAKAGLKHGDIIVQIDNTAVTNLASLSDVLLNKKPGDTVTAQFYRGQQQQSVKVQLGEMPAKQ
jgi:putative serine protease PepD